MFPHENSLLPIFRWRRGDANPEQIGTGVYLELGSSYYLFTAAHVTDHLTLGDLCIPTRHGVRAIAGSVGSNNLTDGVSRTQDRIDVGYIRLDSAHVDERHPNFVPIPAAHIDPLGAIEPGQFCAVAGYPISKGKLSGGVLSTSVFSYVGIAAELSEYSRLGYDPRLNVLIRYRMKKAVYPEGDRLVPPHPRGLSGGGIFRLSESFPDDIQGVPRTLVANMHTFLKKDNYFVGTRLPVYLFNLRTRYASDIAQFTAA